MSEFSVRICTRCESPVHRDLFNVWACPQHGIKIETTVADAVFADELEHAYESGKIEGFQRGLVARDEQIRNNTLPQGIRKHVVPVEDYQELRAIAHELVEQFRLWGRTGGSFLTYPPAKSIIEKFENHVANKGGYHVRERSSQGERSDSEQALSSESGGAGEGA